LEQFQKLGKDGGLVYYHVITETDRKRFSTQDIRRLEQGMAVTERLFLYPQIKTQGEAFSRFFDVSFVFRGVLRADD